MTPHDGSGPGASVPAAVAPCTRCGVAHLTAKGGLACSGHSKRTGQACTNPPMHGQTVCRMHGGSTAAARAAGARRVEQARVTAGIGQVLDELEEQLADRDPLEALLDAVVRARAMATVLGSMLDADKPGFPARLELYERWVAMQARTAKLALDAGVDERQVRIAEAQAEQLATVLRTFAGLLLAAVSDRIPAAVPEREALEQLVPGLLSEAIRSVHPSGGGVVVDVGGEEVR